MSWLWTPRHDIVASSKVGIQAVCMAINNRTTKCNRHVEVVCMRRPRESAWEVAVGPTAGKELSSWRLTKRSSIIQTGEEGNLAELGGITGEGHGSQLLGNREFEIRRRGMKPGDVVAGDAWGRRTCGLGFPRSIVQRHKPTQALTCGPLALQPHNTVRSCTPMRKKPASSGAVWEGPNFSPSTWVGCVSGLRKQGLKSGTETGNAHTQSFHPVPTDTRGPQR